MNWKSIAPKELKENPIALIDGWALLSAGDLESWNTMTVSWGGVGELWSRPVSFVFVRPTRHTFGFTESASRYTLSFFDEGWHDALTLAGTVSGRDHDKAAETGLEPIAIEPDTMAFRQARMVIVSRKLYAQDFDPANFVEPSLNDFYPLKDYHRMYVGEIEQILVRE
jgi:flavin reductase (DIM6/NTAB) family NADH-FMN oxidoreductase RutF